MKQPALTSLMIINRPTGQSDKQSVFAQWRARNLRYLLVLPAVLLILAIGIFPLLYSLGISVLDWDLQRPGRDFIFLANYSDALSDRRLWAALLHTLVIIVFAVTFELLIGLGLAQTLLDPLPGKRFILPLLVLPVVMAPIVVGYTWRMLWDTQYGPISQMLAWLLGRPVEVVWLINPRTVYPAILITESWQWTPFMFLILLAGLTAVNPEIREAAAIDGATSWQISRYVILPLIRPVILLAVLFRALDVFKLFDIVFALTGGGPGTLTETASLYIYILAFKNFRLSYTAAVSIIVLAIVAVFITLLWRQMNKRQLD